jgi:hypothetical protein
MPHLAAGRAGPRQVYRRRASVSEKARSGKWLRLQDEAFVLEVSPIEEDRVALGLGEVGHGWIMAGGRVVRIAGAL